MVSSNVAGFTKKAVASAMMFIAYCAGNISSCSSTPLPYNHANAFFSRSLPLLPLPSQAELSRKFPPPLPTTPNNSLTTFSKSGFLATTLCFAIATICMAILRFVLARENAKRDEQQGVHNGQDNVAWNADAPALSDQTDNKNRDFRYLL
jgi:MFS transporter, ACS family, allantoate permease